MFVQYYYENPILKLDFIVRRFRRVEKSNSCREQDKRGGERTVALSFSACSNAIVLRAVTLSTRLGFDAVTGSLLLP